MLKMCVSNFVCFKSVCVCFVCDALCDNMWFVCGVLCVFCVCVLVCVCFVMCACGLCVLYCVLCCLVCVLVCVVCVCVLFARCCAMSSGACVCFVVFVYACCD